MTLSILALIVSAVGVLIALHAERRSKKTEDRLATSEAASITIQNLGIATPMNAVTFRCKVTNNSRLSDGIESVYLVKGKERIYMSGQETLTDPARTYVNLEGYKSADVLFKCPANHGFITARVLYPNVEGIDKDDVTIEVTPIRKDQRPGSGPFTFLVSRFDPPKKTTE